MESSEEHNFAAAVCRGADSGQTRKGNGRWQVVSDLKTCPLALGAQTVEFNSF